MRVAWIGLGDIGTPMAHRVAAEHDLVVWNRTAARMEPFTTTATSAADAARGAHVVLTCIDTPAGLEAVIWGDDGIAAGRPRLVVDTSTMHPDVARDHAERLAAIGVGFVDAPVSGGPRGAAAGTLAVFLGGSHDDVALAREVVTAFAGRVTHLGPVGAGQVGKLGNQLVNFATMAALAEAAALGTAYGLDTEAQLEAMGGGLADSAMLREYRRGRAAGEDGGITGIVNHLREHLTGVDAGPTAGRVDILLKDLTAALDVAHARGLALPAAERQEVLYREVGGTEHDEPRWILERFLDAWGRHHSARDHDALVALFADDALFLGSAPDLRTDHAGIRAYFDALAEHEGAAVDFEVLAATTSAPGVVEGASIGTFQWDGNPGIPIRFTHTLVRRDGRWVATAHHASPA